MEAIFDVFILVVITGGLLLALSIMGLLVELIPERWMNKMYKWLGV